MGRLYLASLITLGILFAFVFGIIMAVSVYVGSVNIIDAVVFTVIINLVLWLVGPAITDLINRWLHGQRFVSKEDFAATHPEVASIIDEVSKQYNFSYPKIGIIPDQNPTAFTYGSARYNARIVLTEGMFTYLNPQEVRAVVAHELGHIVNRDFIVMMIASTLLQVLYQIYAGLTKSKSDNKKNGIAVLIGLIAYVLYFVGIYLIYFLSRTREYLADEFSAKHTNPEDLSNALIKIAYGIVAAEDSNSAKTLLNSTRHLGILDVKNAKHYGITSYITHSDPKVLEEVMVFDKISPWAFLAEISSTHPLTGKRISHLSDLSKTFGKPFTYSIDSAIARMNIDKSKLYNHFYFGVFIWLLPFILALASLAVVPSTHFPLILGAFAVGLLLQIAYKFPSTPAKPTTILDEMRNPYASPLRGERISLEGQVVGRGVPGYIFGEDMMYQDKTGMIFLDYTSLFGFIGNFFFAITKIKTFFALPSKATGWYFRSMGSMIALSRLEANERKVVSHPILWHVAVPVVLIIVSLVASQYTSTIFFN